MSEDRSNDRRIIAGFLCLMCWCTNPAAHGGVAPEGDLCIIQIGFFEAHFAVFQPPTRGHRGFCEDLPDVTESVFVLEYLHGSLKEMPVDFRIIRDVDKLGRYARWDDIVQIEDIDAVTVFYQPPVIRPEAWFSVVYEFEDPGNYIGIVTTQHPTEDKTYHAVFPFRVGGTGYGYLPLFVALLLLVQLNYWIMSGGYSQWRAKTRLRQSVAAQQAGDD